MVVYKKNINNSLLIQNHVILWAVNQGINTTKTGNIMNNQKEKNKVEFNINFGGFYESNNSYMIDNAIASYFDADDVDCVKESDMDNVDYKAMQYNYGSEWLDLYNNEFNHLTLEYKGIDSPDYYNFETDQIIVSIKTNDVDNLINELKLMMLII